jgi:hypothetical protein
VFSAKGIVISLDGARLGLGSPVIGVIGTVKDVLTLLEAML